MCKMAHSESLFFVKKTQVLCFQLFRTLSYFACTRPSDFNFRTMAFLKAEIKHFVRFFHDFKCLIR